MANIFQYFSSHWKFTLKTENKIKFTNQEDFSLLISNIFLNKLPNHIRNSNRLKKIV